MSDDKNSINNEMSEVSSGLEWKQKWRNIEESEKCEKKSKIVFCKEATEGPMSFPKNDLGNKVIDVALTKDIRTSLVPKENTASSSGEEVAMISVNVGPIEKIDAPRSPVEVISVVAGSIAKKYEVQEDRDDGLNDVQIVSVQPLQVNNIDSQSDEVEIVCEIPGKCIIKSSGGEPSNEASDDVRIIAVEGPKFDMINAKNIEIVAVHPAPLQLFQQLKPVAPLNSPASPSDTESAEEVSELEQNQLMNHEVHNLYDAIWDGMCFCACSDIT